MKKIDQDFTDIVDAFTTAPLGVKCRGKLNHKTALYLQDQGHPIEDTYKKKNGKTHKIPGIASTVKLAPRLIKFFLVTPLSFWDNLLKPEEYKAYINLNIITG